MTITPADLAVGQVWRSSVGVERHILSLDPIRYTLDGYEQKTVTIELLVRRLNDVHSKLVTPAPSPVPHPAALEDLYAVVAAIPVIAEHDDGREFVPTDNVHRLAELLPAAFSGYTLPMTFAEALSRHVKAIDAALAKAGGVNLRWSCRVHVYDDGSCEVRDESGLWRWGDESWERVIAPTMGWTRSVVAAADDFEQTCHTPPPTYSAPHVEVKPLPDEADRHFKEVVDAFNKLKDLYDRVVADRDAARAELARLKEEGK